MESVVKSRRLTETVDSSVMQHTLQALFFQYREARTVEYFESESHFRTVAVVALGASVTELAGFSPLKVK